jgi:hypothetical protein
MIYEIILIFLAGIVIDLLTARSTRAIAEKRYGEQRYSAA